MRSPAAPFLLAFAAACAALPAQDSVYRTPPEPIASLVTAAPPPEVSLSPCRRFLLLVYEEAMPDIAVLARPHRKLAGLRIDAATHGPQLSTETTKIVLQRVDDLSERVLPVPAGHVGGPYWSADGERIAFTRTTETAIELWLATTAPGAPRRVEGVALNAVLGQAVEWLPDQKTLLCKLVTSAPMPPPPAAPAGPNVQTTSPGVKAQVRTNPDMLQSEYDAQCFEALATCQLAYVDAETGAVQPLAAPGRFASVEASPDGELLLVSTIERPFSYLVGWRDFPRRTEIWTRKGDILRSVSTSPLQDSVPIGGVPTGPRAIGWLMGHAKVLRWTEALDGGDPEATAAERDQIQVLTDLAGEPRPWFRTQHRCMGIGVALGGRMALCTEFDRKTRRMRQWQVDAGDLNVAPELRLERSTQDAYGDPGQPVSETLPNGQRPLRRRGDLLYRVGQGQSKDGSRPFLDSWNPVTDAIERLWECNSGRYETFVDFLDDDHILVRSESPTEPTNYVAITLPGFQRRPLTTFRDPAQEFASKVQKQLLRYQRSDGVALSGTLYLPPDHQPGQRHPVLVWAYPQEFTLPSDAGQVRAAPLRYVRFAGTSPLWLLLAGYAVLEDATIPIVGPVRTANDTYVAQLVASAEAAVKVLTDQGIADPERIAIAGHSYGAFMAANLLCHSKLFAAGVARSGAYNRSLTPFGFQNEERTYWQAPEVYHAMSPFAHAQSIAAPLLLIHGEDDNNQGTWPMQSQRLFAAIKGHGGTARLCMLPHEAHGYRARQSVLHCLAETIDWLDLYVKNRRPAPAK